MPDFTALYRFLQRLDDQTIDRAVGETVRRLRGSLRQRRKRARVAVDATGLAQGAVSTFFVRRVHHHGQKPLPPTPWSAERNSRQTRKENLAPARSARRDAARIPATDLPPSCPDRESVLFGETKTFGPCTGSIAAHANAPSSPARIEFQFVPVETSPPFPEDVNRATLNQ